LLRQTHPIVDVGIVCSDFDKSLEFYYDKLGFEIVLDIEIPGDLATTVGLAPSGFRQVRLQAGSTLLKLMQIEAAPPTGSDEFKAGVRWLTYFVADINETVAALKAKGVTFISEPQGTVVAAKDPDGLLVEIVQRLT
jgi:catechol 2,3-dioxygenase-like lactoylglutathione lyase family enzyme